MNHIVIIGFMGSGKTRVGKRLSKELGLPFIDVDKVITQKMKLSVNEIFDRFGEPFYRALETTVLKEMLHVEERTIISLGAGLPLQEQNKKYINQLGTVLYIKGSHQTLCKRLAEGSNPLAEEPDFEEKIKKLLKQRDPVYAGFADVEVVTGVKPFNDLIEEIKEKLETYTKK